MNTKQLKVGIIATVVFICLVLWVTSDIEMDAIDKMLVCLLAVPSIGLPIMIAGDF